jgi:exosortase A-associated hydrolase 2
MTTASSGAIRPEGRFFSTDRGVRYALVHAAPSATNHLILVPPFAEEMNKSRRSFALLARRLAPHGWTVWLPDLKGTGESEGDFGTATWEDWLADIAFFRSEAQSQGARRIVLLGLRFGALLAAASAAATPEKPSQLILWQPVASGEAQLTQFLRLKVAGGMKQAGGAPQSTADLRAQLFAGESIEIAGYLLPGALARAIHELKLVPLIASAECSVRILEVTAASPAGVSPANARVVNELRDRGVDVDAAAIGGEPFWSTVEIAVCEPLLEATERQLVA